MENVIVYQTEMQNGTEMEEFFFNLGFMPFFIEKRLDILLINHKDSYQKIFWEVKCLSDISLLETIQKLYPKAETILIAANEINPILAILRKYKGTIINDITQLYKNGLIGDFKKT